MKRVITSLVSLCLAACLAFPAGALDYTIAAPGDPEYGEPRFSYMFLFYL